ncbi:MAG: hypothetical protein UY78_C0012G0019 [Parcubacteria group bacterium GW2011_GWA1_53_13]|nr:MAG: hypothetical protein UY78_C0012G0019 [Parcubacteria group bacterium GW2011_GWA1_53_13]
MNEHEKLFRKLNKKQRGQLEALVEVLVTGNFQSLNVVKLSGYEKYRVRKGWFRIVFHYEGGGLIIDRIRLRNEDTYKNL